MMRFHEGEQVLVHRVRDEELDPVCRGIIVKTYRPGESFLFQYVVTFGDRRVMVKDEWLDPATAVIQEMPEYSEI